MRHTKRLVYDAIILLLIIAGLVAVAHRFIHLGHVEYTDNATIVKHITPVCTRVPGFIREVRFEDFQRVHRGDTLVIIDDAELRLAVAQARAALASAQAGSMATSAGVATTSSSLSVGDATIDEARAQRDNARRELDRYERLLERQAVTRQQYDAVRTAYETACARYDQVTRARQTTSLVRTEQTHRLTQSEAAIALAQTQLELAELNLSYAAVIATADGVCGERTVHAGQLVQPGMTMADIVDEADLWVIANYRETQLPHIAVGSEVTVEPDALPGTSLTGRVERIADATGSAFSIIPTDNATGNFVKVEQRVPVRIVLTDVDPDVASRLRAGLNVTCEVKY